MGNEANKDEAAKCHHISQQHFRSGNVHLAFKYAQKSVSLYETADAKMWLEKMTVEVAKSPEPEPVQQNDAKAKLASETTESKENGNPATYTPEQVAEVKKFQKIDKNDFYAVLGIKKGAPEADIKRLALQFHPDKNRAPDADEVFKTISQAFGVLGDPDKKKKYDMYGPSVSSQSSSGFSTAGGHPFFDGGEINPEELFRAFFGQSAGFHTFHMGGGGSFGEQPFVYQRRTNRSANANTNASDFEGIRGLVRQLLPIIIFFVFSIFSSWMSSSSEPTVQSFDDVAELVSLNPGLGFPYSRLTKNLKIPYYATSTFQSHFSEYDASITSFKTPPKKLSKLLNQYEGIIEKYYVMDLQRRCKAEVQELNQKMKKASHDEMKKLKEASTPSCDRLHSLGIKH